MELKRHKIRSVRLKTGVRAPGNLRKLMEMPSVKELAASIEQYGLINPPTVRKDTKEIIAGRNRVAAHFVLNRDMIEVCYVDVEDLHARALEIAENLHRRHDPQERDKLQEELLRIYEAQEIADDEDARAVGNTRGPKASPRRRAIKRVAKETGKSVSAVQRSAQRSEKKKRELVGAAAAMSDKPPVNTFGLEVDPEFLSRLSEIQAAMDSAYSGLMEAQRRLARLENKGTPLQRIARASLKGLYSDAAKHTKYERPKSICPGCKLIETILPSCSFCLGTGYASEKQWAIAPSELKSDKVLVVQVGAGTGNATFVSYDSMFDYEDDETGTSTPDLKEDDDLSGLFTLE